MSAPSHPIHSPSGRLDGMPPVAVAARLRHLPGLVFFDTAGNLPATATNPVSIVAAAPRRILHGRLDDSNSMARLRAALTAGRAATGPHGALCGWVTYEGNFVFGDYREMLAFDHASGGWWEHGDLAGRLAAMPAADTGALGSFVPGRSREDFITAAGQARRHIAAGTIYQVNLSQAFTAPAAGGSLFGLYQALRAASPAPMAAYLNLADTEVLSSSPESFLQVTGRHIRTHPIKGTRPRFADPAADAASARELLASPKENAELVMITDLLRNDLGRVCEFGSVRVDSLLRLETLAQVHHLVSTVSGTLRSECDALAALAACFPGGSITGAPKLSAMQIIRTLEPVPRGVYCGAIGWLGYAGDGCFNIPIRTLVRCGDTASYHVGAGIVADSDPAAEYQETLDKAAGLRLAIERWLAEARHT